MESPQEYSTLLGRINKWSENLEKAASVSVTEDDPTEKGKESIPSDPANTPDKQNLPDNEKNGPAPKKLEDADTNPAPTGENTESTLDGNAKDEREEKEAGAKKIAQDAKALAAKIAQFSNPSGTSKEKAGAPQGKAAGSSAPDDTKAANTEIASDFDDEYLRKMARAICETEGGLEAVEPILLKHAGQQAAFDIMEKAAGEYDTILQQQQHYQDYAMQKQAHDQAVAQEIGAALEQMSPEQRQSFEKTAALHDAALGEFGDNDFLKSAYMAGAADGAAMLDNDAGGGGLEIPGAAQGAPTLEEILQLLELMVQSGELDPETAKAVAAELLAQEEGGGEGMPMPEEGMPMPEEGMPMPEEGMLAEASYKEGPIEDIDTLRALHADLVG